MAAEQAAMVADGQRIIKAHMPHTYAAILDQARHHGRTIWALVRRGLAGEPHCFWAREGGYTVGTLADGADSGDGSACVCIVGRVDVPAPVSTPVPLVRPAHDAEWRAPADAYHGHHFGCAQCISAGQGRGGRCGVGQPLWRTYADAVGG
ncbi:hypothetical protein D8I35_09500 [Corticibacter populi]|uniref:Uncharacterized protein n=2 Tax=Corticibacter populi TaxID=1550736 RepID=A0A3M6QUM3_9BURK|nr:hypothetical protein D8I35_09500 [Corticibacter populi]RZS31693.1 hypothetical protein EV687_2362 [Corticibacter populi]